MDAPSLADSAFALGDSCALAVPPDHASLDAVAWLYAICAVLVVASLIGLAVHDMLGKGKNA